MNEKRKTERRKKEGEVGVENVFVLYELGLREIRPLEMQKRERKREREGKPRKIFQNFFFRRSDLEFQPAGLSV